MLLGSGADAGTGPGARGILVGRSLVVCARDMRPPPKTAGGRGQDCPHAGTRAEAPRTSAVVFALFESAQSLGERCVRFEAKIIRNGAVDEARANRVVGPFFRHGSREQPAAPRQDAAPSSPPGNSRRTTASGEPSRGEMPSLSRPRGCSTRLGRVKSRVAARCRPRRGRQAARHGLR